MSALLRNVRSKSHFSSSLTVMCFFFLVANSSQSVAVLTTCCQVSISLAFLYAVTAFLMLKPLQVPSRPHFSEQCCCEDDDDVAFAVSNAHITGPFLVFRMISLELSSELTSQEQSSPAAAAAETLEPASCSSLPCVYLLNDKHINDSVKKMLHQVEILNFTFILRLVVGAQSTLGAKTFLPEKKIYN